MSDGAKKQNRATQNGWPCPKHGGEKAKVDGFAANLSSTALPSKLYDICGPRKVGCLGELRKIRKFAPSPTGREVWGNCDGSGSVGPPVVHRRGLAVEAWHMMGICGQAVSRAVSNESTRCQRLSGWTPVSCTFSCVNSPSAVLKVVWVVKARNGII